MDEITKTIVDEFMLFLAKELPKDKRFKIVQLTKWSVKGFKVTIKFYVNGNVGDLYFDVRELKENRYRFGHLLDNAIEQLKNTISL